MNRLTILALLLLTCCTSRGPEGSTDDSKRSSKVKPSGEIDHPSDSQTTTTQVKAEYDGASDASKRRADATRSAVNGTKTAVGQPMVKPTESNLKPLLSAVIARAHEIQAQGLVDERAVLAVQSNAPDLETHWTSLLEEIAGDGMMKRRPYDEVTRSKSWPKLMKSIKGAIQSEKADAGRRLARLIDALRVGIKHAGSDRIYERLAGYGVIFELLDQREFIPNTTFGVPYLNVLTMGYMPERSSDEKRVLLRYWRSFATPKFKDFLFMVALTDTDWQVRESALLALTNCARRMRGCGMTTEELNAFHNAQPDVRTRSVLYRYAGASRRAIVVDWCSKKLNSVELGVACQDALSVLKTNQGFDALYEWLNQRMHAPETRLPNALSFRDEFRAIAPYANEPYARDRYLRLIKRVLLQSDRSGYATGAIVKMLSTVSDHARAIEILDDVQAFYLKRLGPSPLVAADKFLMKTIEQTKRKLVKSR